ncbi:WD40 repeat-like protein, partial [Rhodotorula sp. JG-1b]
IEPRLQRDFLASLPAELALHVLSFVDDPKTLTRAARVSKAWYNLIDADETWKRLCLHNGYPLPLQSPRPPSSFSLSELRDALDAPPPQVDLTSRRTTTTQIVSRHRHRHHSTQRGNNHDPPPPSYKSHFKHAHQTAQSWLLGPGRLLSTQMSAADNGVVTSLAFDSEWIVVAMETSQVHVFEGDEGGYVRTLEGHQQSGVWCLRSACSTARGWGQDGAVLVSGGCDRTVRVWDVSTGYCIHTLTGHTSTVRCLRVLDSRPLAISGSRDGTVRVWDIDKGEAVHVLNGHAASVRAIDVCGSRAVSASYDMTCRLWDVDSGECLHVFRGHTSKIYSVAFDGERVVTGSLDSTVRVWSAHDGNLIALLQGHSTLVGQLQLDPYTDTLLTGGSDGRVIVFSLESYQPVHVLEAHSTSVTCLQFDRKFIVTGGNDGRIKLWDFRTGTYIRDLCDPSIGIWRVVIRDDKMVTLSRR